MKENYYVDYDGYTRDSYKECKTCSGTGEIHSHNPKCFSCRGGGHERVVSIPKKENWRGLTTADNVVIGIKMQVFFEEYNERQQGVVEDVGGQYVYVKETWQGTWRNPLHLFSSLITFDKTFVPRQEK